MSNLLIAPSKIHGIGIFTKVNIPKGTRMFLVADLNEYEKGGNIMTKFGGLINHSKNPNCGFFGNKNSSMVFLKPLRNIDKGEELTINYEILPFPFKSNVTGYKQ